MVVISFAPKGAWARVLGSIFPRLAPLATICHPSADGLAGHAINLRTMPYGGSVLRSVPELPAQKITQRVLPPVRSQ
jgi:hypothetical protein